MANKENAVILFTTGVNECERQTLLSQKASMIAIVCLENKPRNYTKEYQYLEDNNIIG